MSKLIRIFLITQILRGEGVDFLTPCIFMVIYTDIPIQSFILVYVMVAGKIIFGNKKKVMFL